VYVLARVRVWWMIHSADFSMVNQTFRLKFNYNGCTLGLVHSEVGVVHPLLLGTLLNFIIKNVFVPVTEQNRVRSVRKLWIR
jgi:hypothetical protein